VLRFVVRSRAAPASRGVLEALPTDKSPQDVIEVVPNCRPWPPIALLPRVREDRRAIGGA
jgi:hypothetical protein